MSCEAILALPDDLIDRVVFYRRNELRVDPLCCEVNSRGIIFFAHQEDRLWRAVVERLEALPGFMSEWRAEISEPPRSHLELVAYERIDPPMIAGTEPAI